MTCERRKTTQNKEINGGFLSTWGIMLPILEHIIAKSNRSKVDYKGQAHMVANTYANYSMTNTFPNPKAWEENPLHPTFGTIMFWMALCESIEDMIAGEVDTFCYLYNAATFAVNKKHIQMLKNIDKTRLCMFLKEHGWKETPFKRSVHRYYLSGKIDVGEQSFQLDWKDGIVMELFVPNCNCYELYQHDIMKTIITIARAHKMTPADVILNTQKFKGENIP